MYVASDKRISCKCFFLIFHKNICCGTQCLAVALLMSTYNQRFCEEIRKLSILFGCKTHQQQSRRDVNLSLICFCNVCHRYNIYIYIRAPENRKNSRSGPKLRILDRFQTPENANK